MARLITTIGAPFILLLSIPFAFFALLTTLFAFWILLFRVSIVYVELLTALAQAYLLPARDSSRLQSDVALASPTAPPSPVTGKGRYSPPSKRASRSSSISSDILLRASSKNDTTVTQAVRLSLRDYEDVGGWMEQGDRGEDGALWMREVTSRPEMPAPPPRPHRRSFGAGMATPDLVRTPGRVKTPGIGGGGGREKNHRRGLSGTMSPEGYFNVPFGALSIADKDKTEEQSRRSGSNSSVSLSSAGKTVRLEPA